MEKRFLARRCAILLAGVLAVFAPMAAYAADGGSGKCGLFVSYKDGTDPIPGVKFRVYRAAEYLGRGEYSLDSNFSGCGAILDGSMTNSKWEAAAEAMYSYAQETGVRPDASGKTGENGALEVQGLEPGVYFVEGDKTMAGGTCYTPQAFCVELPGRSNGGEPVYTVTAEPKHDAETEMPEETEETTEPPTTPKTGDTAGRVGCQALILAGLSVLAALAAARAMRMRKETGHAGT